MAKKITIRISIVLVMSFLMLFGCGKEETLNVIDDNYRNYYEIFVYSFYDSDGDGIGDLNGVTEKLDYIEDMGFNGIWLMPIMQSTTYHKYDVVDYYSIDYEYGTIDDFINLVEECHKRGINVVIDFVINHTSSQNIWFELACDYLKDLNPDEEPNVEDCPYFEYYHFSKEQVDSTYYNVPGTDWYYEGSFWSEMPDLNLASVNLRTELEDIARFWVQDIGVDGFRMDAAMHFEENDTEFNNEVLNWLYTLCKGMNPDFYMVSEVWASKATIEDYYASQTPSMFNFDASGAEGKIVKTARGSYKAASFVESMLGYQNDYSAVNSDYIDAPFIANHDMARVANNLMNDENDMKMACGLLMTMNGSTFVYYGEEIGMSSSGTKDENKRLPFIWSKTDTTGMTNGPVDADKGIESAFEAEDVQIKDSTSILNYYKRAIRLRNENPEIARGEITIIDELTEGNQAAIIKTYEDSSIGIVYNTSDDEISIDLSGTQLENMKIKGYLTLNDETITLKNGILYMKPQSICILK
jgi:glycosidase